MSQIKTKAKLMSDEDLVRMILSKNDPLYFEEIYDRYASRIYQKCLSFTKDTSEAKDVAHDVMVKIYLSLNKFSYQSKLATWIFRITYNHCVDHENRKAKQISMVEELQKNQKISREIEPNDSELLEINVNMLNGLLNKLSAIEKSLLLMKYQDGLTIKDICEMTDMGESAIKMKIKRSKEKLMKLYGSRKKA